MPVCARPTCENEFEAKVVLSNPKQYCTRRCYMAYYHTLHPRGRSLDPARINDRVCERDGCDVVFTPKQRGATVQKYCSSRCYQKDYRRKYPKNKTLARIDNRRFYENNKQAILKKKKSTLRCECGRVRYKGETECPRCNALPTASNFLPKELGNNP